MSVARVFPRVFCRYVPIGSALGALFLLSSCHGEFGDREGADGAGAPGAGAASGAIPGAGNAGQAAGGPGSGGADPGGGPLQRGFSRLTRAEYAATIQAALGVEPDISLIPVDGRIGPFTSNATVSPDPVHPYLLAGEAVATAAIPSRFAVCEATTLEGATACVRETYGQALEQLYRRPLGDPETERAARILVDLRARGVSATEATRAMLSTALLSPDLLFRSSVVASSAEAAVAERMAEHLSFALWDAPPDAELTAALAETTGSELATRSSVQATRMLAQSRAVAVLARFLAQWLHVDVDLRAADPAFEVSPRFREWLAFTEHTLASGLPVTSLVSGTQGFVHEENLAAYGLSTLEGTPDAGVVPVTWPLGSPRRGLLGQDLIADSTRHPDSSRRVIFRGKLVRTALLCQAIPAPSADLLAMAGEVGDRTTDPRCSSCHRLMDPIGGAFAPLDADAASEVRPAQVIGGELEGTYPDLPALLDAVSGSRAFAECFARHWLAFFLEARLEDVDAAWIGEIADSVVAGATLGGVLEKTIVSLAERSEATPWCEGS